MSDPRSRKPDAPDHLDGHPGDQRSGQPLKQIGETSDEARDEAQADHDDAKAGKKGHGTSRP